MTKAQLVDAVAARTGLTRKQSTEAVDAALVPEALVALTVKV